MLNKKSIILSSLVVFMFIVFLATPSTTVEADDVSIRWAMHPGIWNDAVIEYFAPKYEEETGVEVIIEQLPPDEMRERVMLEAHSGSNYYDISYHSPAWFGYYYEHVADLTPYIEKYDFDISAYSDMVVEGYMRSEIRPGDYIALPHYVSTVMLAYREDFFNHPDEKEAFEEEYGRELRSPQTWEEFYEVGKFFTRDAGETVAGEELERPLYGFAQSLIYPSGAAREFLAMFYSMGFEGFDENYRPDFDHPMFVEGSELYKKIVDDIVPEMAFNWALIEDNEFYRDGRSAMGFLGAGGVEIFEDPEVDGPARGNTVYTSLPRYEDNLKDLPIGISYLAGGGLLIFDTPESEEAFKFLQWMLEENGDEFARRTGAFSRQEHFDDPELQDRFPASYLDAFSEALQYAFPRQAIPEFGEVIWNAAGDYWNDVIHEDATIEEAREEWINTMERVFEREGYYE